MSHNKLERMRTIAWRIMRAALQSIDPGDSVRRHLNRSQNTLTLATPSNIFVTYDLDRYERILVVGAGKAGVPMSAAVAQQLGERLTTGIAITKYGYRREEIQGTGEIELVEAGHPLPDQAGVEATKRIIELLESTTKKDLVIVLISGGGSSLLAAPVDGVSLEDLQLLTKALLVCGASIHEMNVVRKHLSRVQGGQLAKLASAASKINLILSDVVGDPMEAIASGPTVPDPSTFSDAWAILERFQLVDSVPDSVRKHLRAGLEGHAPETPKSCEPFFHNVRNVIVGSNLIAAQAALAEASRCGYQTSLLTTCIEGEAREVGKVLAGFAKGVLRGEAVSLSGQKILLPACFIGGGETTVTLHGTGAGGRNQEMALAAALAMEGWENFLLACLATDGGDGTTDAAGAFADGTTVARARQAGMNPVKFLQNNDSYHFFQNLDDLIITGPTLTNVNDLMVILLGSPPSSTRMFP